MQTMLFLPRATDVEHFFNSTDGDRRRVVAKCGKNSCFTIRERKLERDSDHRRIIDVFAGRDPYIHIHTRSRVRSTRLRYYGSLISARYLRAAPERRGREPKSRSGGEDVRKRCHARSPGYPRSDPLRSRINYR